MAVQRQEQTVMDHFMQFTSTTLQPWLYLAGAIIAALVLHALVYSLLSKTLKQNEDSHTYRILHKSKNISRLALLIITVQISLPVLPLSANAHELLTRMTSIGLIFLAGWLAIMAINTATELILARHKTDSDENLEERKIRTRLRVLRQAVTTLIFFVTIACMLMTFPGARSLGLSLFASAGVAGIVVGFAARPVLSNLLAGIQIALTQPIRIDDAVVIEGEWGWIEDITSTYVVVKIWDWRRLIVPLSYVIEHPFQNWSRESASIIGTVTWFTDYTVPIDLMRGKLKELLAASSLWDGNVQVLQVINANAQTLELRALMSARNSPTAWDLRCEIREKMVDWLQQNYPQSLPKNRIQITDATAA